jgi:phytoene/squalene synthetase
VLRAALAERNLSPQHAQDLLKAFRQDVTKHRYADWDELIDYCRYSAMPVGRFVLDVHGESRSTWPASDNVCAVLQIINHLQDCVKDYRALDRVYIPLDALKAAGSSVEALEAPRAPPQLLACLHGLADRTGVMLEQGSMLPAQINDRRLVAGDFRYRHPGAAFRAVAADQGPAERKCSSRQVRGRGVRSAWCRERIIWTIIWTLGPRAGRRHQITSR